MLRIPRPVPRFAPGRRKNPVFTELLTGTETIRVRSFVRPASASACACPVYRELGRQGANAAQLTPNFSVVGSNTSETAPGCPARSMTIEADSRRDRIARELLLHSRQERERLGKVRARQMASELLEYRCQLAALPWLCRWAPCQTSASALLGRVTSCWVAQRWSGAGRLRSLRYDEA